MAVAKDIKNREKAIMRVNMNHGLEGEEGLAK
jgi:hypothetical protein